MRKKVNIENKVIVSRKKSKYNLEHKLIKILRIKSFILEI